MLCYPIYFFFIFFLLNIELVIVPYMFKLFSGQKYLQIWSCGFIVVFLWCVTAGLYVLEGFDCGYV